MTVLDFLDEIEDIVDTASAVPLTNKIMVDGNELKEIVKEIRISLPDDVQQAKWVRDEKHRILAEAKQEYERIILEAKKQAEYLVEENDITRRAYKRAEEVMADVEKQSRYMKMSTYEYLDKILYDMQGKFDDVNGNYLNQLFTQMSRQFDEMGSVLQSNREELKNMIYDLKDEEK